MIGRILAVLTLAASAAACSSSNEPAGDPKELLAASVAELRAGNYRYTAVMPKDRVDGVVHLPSRSMSQTLTDTSRPELHEAAVIVIDQNHFLRTRADRTWLEAQQAEMDPEARERMRSTGTKMLEEAMSSPIWQQTDLRQVDPDRRSRYPTLENPDFTGATDLLSGVQTATAEGRTVTGTLDATRLDRSFTAFSIAEWQAAADVPYRATLDERGRLTELALDLPGISKPPRPAARWILTMTDYGAATAPERPRNVEVVPQPNG